MPIAAVVFHEQHNANSEIVVRERERMSDFVFIDYRVGRDRSLFRSCSTNRKFRLTFLVGSVKHTTSDVGETISSLMFFVLSLYARSETDQIPLVFDILDFGINFVHRVESSMDVNRHIPSNDDRTFNMSLFPNSIKQVTHVVCSPFLFH